MKFLYFIFVNVIFLFVYLFAYSLFHELGHAIVGILCGGKINRVRLGFHAYIEIEGAKYTKFTKSLMHSGGVSLPYVVILVLFTFYKTWNLSYLYNLFYVLLMFSTIGSLIPWLVIPIKFCRKQTIKSEDDAIKFLISSNANPSVVAAISLLSVAFMLIVFIYNGVPYAFISLIKSIQEFF